MKYYLLLLLIIIAGCTTVEEGMVNYPDDRDIMITVDETTTTTELSMATTTQPSEKTNMETTTTALVTTTAPTATTTAGSGDINIKEGDLLKLNLRATDPDNNPITYSYSSPLDENGEWQTEVGDAGTYNVIVKASDGKLETTKTLKIVVSSKNNAPVIENLDEFREITITEGETITINPEVTDIEDDAITITYSGFMTSNTYESGYDDAGTYTAHINVNDGINSVKEQIKITILNKNRAPVLEDIDDIEVIEGENVQMDVSVTDPDGDEVTLTYSEPLDEEGAWETGIGDEGEYDVTVTASDGDLSDEITFSIKVMTENSAPILSGVEDLEISEGQTIVLNPTVSDPDGDEVTVSYSGWMTESIYVTTYDDEGEHTVTVTASDGKTETSKDITITVLDSNRAPTDLEIEIIVIPGE